MDIGVHLPQLGRGASREALIEFCSEAERLGVHSGWVSDHIAWPSDIASKYPYTDDGSFPAPNDIAWLDPIGTLLFVAAVTQNMKLGQTVLIMGYRPPVQTAKMMATLDVLSNGRAILGAGVGWMKEEFEVLGMPYDHRGARADEQLEIFTKLFTEETPSYQGTYYQFPEIRFEPKPPQGRIPVWIGGASEAAFRRTARYGDCFHAAFEPIGTVKDEWARVQELVVEAGRPVSDVTLSIRLYLDPASAMKPKVSVAGSAEQMIDTLSEWAGIGVDHVLVDITAPGGPKGRLEAMQAFMTDVVPHV
ncbi:MAG: LLM class F420-dependent oxidoreductase [Actinomycetota bacterium]|nr:LLM class F420-dependent oxidoreductase [Actinomycetota bacterium]